MARGRRPTRPILPTPRATSPLDCSRLRQGPRWAQRSGETATGAAVTSTSTPTGRTTSRGTSTTRTSPTPASSTEPREGAGKAETSGSTTPSMARAESDSKAGVGKAGSGSRARAARAESVSREAAASATVEHRHHPALAVSARVAPVKAASRVAPSREWEAAVTLRASATAATRAVTASIDRLVEEELGAVAAVGAVAVAAAEEVVDDSANLVARVRDHVRARSGGGRAGKRPGARAREAGSTHGRKAGDRAETGGGAAKELRVSRGGDAGPRRGPARGRHQGAVGDPRQREPRARFLRRCGGRQAEPREVPERVRRSEQARRER